MLVATAGHVDHGKTTLIQRLTGTNTDRLAEEKQRGLTIELGYAFGEAGANEPIGFIDVPGHHRFINTMISGINGIDLGMLVVAADDGPMPQTLEHLQLLRLLGVERFAGVISKSDLVDKARLDEVVKQVGVLIPDAPLRAISNRTGEGVEQLQSLLDKQLQDAIYQIEHAQGVVKAIDQDAKQLADALIEEVKALTNRLIVDHPHADPAPYMGPVIDNEAADGLTESFLILMSNGGRVIRHMTRPVAGRPFLTPGIIDVTWMPERPDIELFGPLLQVIRVDTFEAAIAEANNTAFGLSAALVGGTPQLYDQFWANARAGVINWNRPTNRASPAAPFGGIGLSGNHRPSAFYAADYCAYPVASAESDALRAAIGVGLRDPEGSRLIPKNYN